MTGGAPTVDFRRDGRWLRVRCGGTGSAEWLAELFLAVGQSVSREPADAVLIDVRAVSVHLTMTERYRIAASAADWWPGPPVALVATPAFVDEERFGELVARSRGLDVLVSTDADAAERWLQSRVAARSGPPA